ncbi:MAG: helix-turn-helix domain-containing protein [Acidimicrobiales bacterium]
MIKLAISNLTGPQSVTGPAGLGGDNRFLTAAEVAGLLRVSTMTVYRLIQAGDIPAVRVGKSYRVRQVDIDGYLARAFTQAG